MCRFFAHLCLYLQMIDVTVPPLATQVILEAYLQVLEVCSSVGLQFSWLSETGGPLAPLITCSYAPFMT